MNKKEKNQAEKHKSEKSKLSFTRNTNREQNRGERSREEHKAAMDSRVAQPDPGMAWIHTQLLATVQHTH